MLLGLLSDTHDRVDATATAVKMLLDAGAEYFLHCGDLGSRRGLEPFKAVASGFVWGDQDRDRMGLLRYADPLQIQCFGVLGDFYLEDKHIAITHGDDARLLKRLIKEGEHDFLLHGHTPKLRDERQGRTRILCPGALHGGSERTALLLNTQSGETTVIRVPSQ